MVLVSAQRPITEEEEDMLERPPGDTLARLIAVRAYAVSRSLFECETPLAKDHPEYPGLQEERRALRDRVEELLPTKDGRRRLDDLVCNLVGRALLCGELGYIQGFSEGVRANDTLLAATARWVPPVRDVPPEA